MSHLALVRMHSPQSMSRGDQAAMQLACFLTSQSSVKVLLLSWVNTHGAGRSIRVSSDLQGSQF